MMVALMSIVKSYLGIRRVAAQYRSGTQTLEEAVDAAMRGTLSEVTVLWERVASRRESHRTAANDFRWGHACRAEDGMCKKLRDGLHGLKPDEHGYCDAVVREAFNARLIALTSARYKPFECPSGPYLGRAPYAVDGRFASKERRTRNFRERREQYRNWTPLGPINYRAKLTVKRLKHLRGGSFGKLQLLYDAQELLGGTGSVELPTSRGPGVTGLDGKLLTSSQLDSIRQELNKSTSHKKLFGRYLRDRDIGHLVCEVRQHCYAGPSSSRASLVAEWDSLRKVKGYQERRGLAPRKREAIRRVLRTVQKKSPK
jgi:hypothetical protein